MTQFNIISHVPANMLTNYDRFKMAGQMYMIDEVRRNAFDERVVRFHPIFGRQISSHTMIVPKNTMFKVYNQKPLKKD